VKPVAVETAETGNRLVDVTEHRHALVIENGETLFGVRSPEDRIEDRLVGIVVLAVAVADHRHQLGRREERRFAVEREDGVDLLALEGCVQRHGVVPGLRLPCQVDRVLRGAEVRRDRAEDLSQRVCIVVERHVVLLAGIGGEHADAAAIGDDDRVSSIRGGRVREELAEIEGLLHALGPQDPDLTHDGVEDVVGPGERTGV